MTKVRNSSLQHLADLDETGWTAGLVVSLPVDRQLQRTLVRQLELRLVKANAALSAQEQLVAEAVGVEIPDETRGRAYLRAAVSCHADRRGLCRSGRMFWLP